MNVQKVAIMFQVAGVLDLLAGGLFILFFPQQGLLGGIILTLMGVSTFWLGRTLLNGYRKNLLKSRITEPQPLETAFQSAYQRENLFR